MLSNLLSNRSGSNPALSASGIQYGAMRCRFLSKYFDSQPVKKLHQDFPRLLSNIFGFDGTQGWDLSGCNIKANVEEFNTMQSFLAPHGPMFQLISKLEEKNLHYEFPISCLPRPSQQLLMEGIIPPFYEEKVQLNIESGQGVPDHIFLSAFEYYIFHFIYYVIDVQKQPWLVWTSLLESLYTTLFAAYLNHFLPCSGPIPSFIGSSPSCSGVGDSYSSQTLDQIHSGRCNSSGFQSQMVQSLGLLKTRSEAKYVMTHTITNQVGTLQSEIFIQVVVELWLNHSDYDNARHDFISHTQQQFIGQELVRLLRMFVKHILHFTSGSSYSPSPTSTFSSPIVSITDTLRSSVLSVYLQKKVYQFLRHAFKHWPFDETFKYEHIELTKLEMEYAICTCVSGTEYSVSESRSYKYRATDIVITVEGPVVLKSYVCEVFKKAGVSYEVLELWLTYIQPWRYTDPLRPATENKHSLEQVPCRWQVYVMEHYPFYSSLLVEFLLRAFQLDLMSDLEVFFLYRVSKVFSQEGLMDFIQTGEHLLLTSPSSLHHSSSPTTRPNSIKALFDHLEGPIPYHPLFDPVTTDAVESLNSKVVQARSQIESNQSHSLGIDEPHTRPHQQTWKSWLSELFHEDPQHVYDALPRPSIDPTRLLIFLSAIEQNLRKCFGISPHSYPVTTNYCSPALQGRLSRCHTDTFQLGSGDVQHQEYTWPSKYSSLAVPFLGDIMLQPIRNYENAALVRCLYKLSCYLNNKFSPQLRFIGNSKSLYCKLIRQLLAPPHPLDSAIKQKNVSHVPHQTPSGRVVSTDVRPFSLDTNVVSGPRINLRVFGSYYTLANIGVSICVVSLLPVPVWIWLIVVVMFMCLFCLIKYALS